jgi:hypothetical protein
LGENEVRGTYSTAQISAVNKAYRMIFPSYNLPDTGVYQSFRYGDTLFLMTDVNTFISPISIFGTTQYNWLLSQITNAANDPRIKAIFITISQPWNYVSSAYDWDTIKQNYDSLLTNVAQEKKDIGDAFRKNINFNRPENANFKSVMMLVGQPHVAFDDGSWNNYGNFPIAVCGPIDYWQQCRGGPYSHGSFHDAYSQYCNVQVYQMPTGNTCIQIKGVIPKTTKKTSQEQTLFLYDTCQPNLFKGKINIKCPIDYKEKILNAGITLACIIFIYVFFFVFLNKVSLKAFNYQTIKEE